MHHALTSSGAPPPLQHGTCVGGKLTRSKAAYFSTGLEYVKKFTKPGTAAQRAFSDNAGKNVTLEFLNAAYSAPLINQVRCPFSPTAARLSSAPSLPAARLSSAPSLPMRQAMVESVSGGAMCQLPASSSVVLDTGVALPSVAVPSSDASQHVLQWSATCHKHPLLPSPPHRLNCCL
jgi:hypothetical protein